MQGFIIKNNHQVMISDPAQNSLSICNCFVNLIGTSLVSNWNWREGLTHTFRASWYITRLGWALFPT